MSHQHQCVPTWDFDDVVPVPQVSPPAPAPQQPQPQLPGVLNSRSYHSAAPDTSMLDYGMAELTWENGQPTMHGLGQPRGADKPSIGGAWIDKPFTRASGTLESIINQGYSQKPAPPVAPGGACDHDAAWSGPTDPAASVPLTTDALVPNNGTHNGDQGVGTCVVRSSTRVGSCSTMAARVPGGSDWSVSMSASESTRRQRLKRPAEDTCEQLRSMNNGFTSTSFGASPENTKTFTVDEYDSACHSSPKERREEEKNGKQGTNKSTATKRSTSRAAAIHNQSERKRRDKINQRMKTLQKLVPNSNKTDKASMLDEVIDYLKQLQAQVQMLSKMSMPMPSMMMPLAIQQQLQMSMLAPMGMGLGMGMGMEHMNMSFNSMGRPNITGIPPAIFNPAAYSMPLSSSNGTPLAGGDHCLSPADHLSAYLACHSHPMTIDAYTRMAAMYQQLQQQQQCQHQHQHQHQQPGPSSNT